MAATAQHTLVGQPHRQLTPLVQRYEGFEYSGLAPGSHQGLPSGRLTFIISLAEPIRVMSMPGPQSPGTFQAVVGGLQTTSATIAHTGSGSGISIALSPFACRSLFGMPAAALTSSVVELGDLIGSRATELLDQLLGLTSWDARFAAVDRALLAVRRDAATPSPEVVRAWDVLSASAGSIPTGQLAADVGYSRRHLTQRFSDELGIAPKAASRVFRFEHACALLDGGLGLAEAAARAGYYDQAHMTNEWKDMAGQSPTAWQLEVLRDQVPERVSTQVNRVA